MKNIRNFSIIAHVDHGKSTLADRFLDLTGSIEKRKMREQFLDQMELERERGITIKMQPVRMIYHPHRGPNADSTQKVAESTLLYQDLTYKIRGILFRVRKNLGLGHKEQVYHNALEIEFRNAGLSFASKKNIVIRYNGHSIGTYQPDFIIDDKILIELKALPEIGRPQVEQLWAYLKGCDYKLALLVNFGSKDLEIKRIVYETARESVSAFSALSPRRSAGDVDKVEYILNLIDTPGHADFSYEVSRSLAAVEGAILLVDATKGIQAQTFVHLNFAKKQNLVIIPAVNKVDLPQARTEEVVKEVAMLLSVDPKEVYRISAKEGTNVKELLQGIIEKVPAPKDEETGKPFYALIFDSRFDSFKGIVAFVRVMEGSIQKDELISLLGTGISVPVKEVGVFLPQETPCQTLSAGEIGYIATGIKEPEKVRIGDTIAKSSPYGRSPEGGEILALPGFQIPKPVVFVSFYPANPDDFDLLKDALAKLRLNDPSFSFAAEAREVLGRGFRCGFLGILHSEIIAERIQREFKIDLVISQPLVEITIVDNKDRKVRLHSAVDWPPDSEIKETYEPWVKLKVLTPLNFFQETSHVLQNVSGRPFEVQDMGDSKALFSKETPLRAVIGDFYDRLKSATSGMASMDYEILEDRKGDLVKLEFLVAGQKEEALATIVPKDRAYAIGKTMVEKLKKSLPAQLFDVTLQAFSEGRIIARETVSAQRKDVTAPLYGGDVTRKKKLLEIQKKGKKELKAKGKVIIPARVFLELFRS